MTQHARRAVCAAAIVVVALFGLRPAAANPGCSLDDIGNAAKDTFTNIPWSCTPQAADPVFYPALAYIIALLQTPQGADFCSAAENIQASASDAQKQISGYWNKLSADQQAKLTEFFPDFANLSSGAADITGALNIVSCACQTAQWKGPGDLASDFGACATDALCSVDNWLHDNVWSGFGSCSDGNPPSTPMFVDCRRDPKSADSNGNYSWDQTIPFVGNGNNCDAGPPAAGQGDNGYECKGDVCLSESVPPYANSGNYCYCPQVMQHWDQYGDDDGCIGFLNCRCPDGSKPLSDDPAQSASYICVCPDTGLPVNDDGSCPPPPPKCEPSCPAGQISKISDKNTCSYTCGCPDGLTKTGDKCVTPCADASQVMLASGACCAAAQATSCGTCCPIGMKPDASGQGCVSALPPHKGPFTPIKLPNQPKRQL